MKKWFLLHICILGCFLGCSGGEDQSTLCLGTWRMEGNSGQHTIMSVRNNGSVEIDLRIEGDLTKLITKIGSASGNWDADIKDGVFTLSITQGVDDIGYPEGETTYRIEQLDKLNMVLVSPTGQQFHWMKSSRPETESTELEGVVIPLAPLVVSLVPSTNEFNRRYKWLCIAMDIHLSSGGADPVLPPELKDKVIMQLSSKVYEDVNTLDKLETVSTEIRNLLNPYLDGAVDKVVFTRSIVTGMQDAVDSFCAEFQ